MAFVVSSIRLLPSKRHAARCNVTCSANDSPSMMRRAFLFAISTAATSTLCPAVSNAVGTSDFERAISKVFFPKEGFNAADKPLEGAIVDKSILESSSGKAALATLRKYQSDIIELYTEFKADPQLKLTSRVNKMFNISELRDALNVFGEAFDEAAQLETDKVVRNIIQDIGELEAAVALREGAVRTERKIQRTTDWFEKLVSDFKKLVSFYA